MAHIENDNCCSSKYKGQKAENFNFLDSAYLPKGIKIITAYM